MKKRSLQLIFTIFITILLITAVSASIKSNKKTYNTKESVYVLSTVGVNDNLCRSQNPPEKVKIHIVEHKQNWNNGDTFEDVRGEPNEIPNSRFSNTKIWNNPQTGNYDLIVDCNENQAYDESSEPIYNEGFLVIPKKGQGSMATGHRNPQNFEWQYDPETPILSKEIFQIKLLAIDEDIQLENISLEIKSPQETTNIEIYFDSNNNGIIDTNDKLITKKESAKKSEIISLDYKIRQDIGENFLFIFNNNENTLNGEYNIKILSITGRGTLSEKEISFFGNPLESNTMNVVDKKSCIGEMVLELTPNPMISNKEVIAKITGLTGCDDKKIKLKSNECFVATGDIEECTLKSNTCEIKIKGIKGRYFACIDKNNDNNYNGFGESISIDLKLKEIKEEPKYEEINTTNKESSKITGNVIGNLDINNPLLIILEITLLLILILLILIFYKTLKPKTIESIQDEKEDDSDLFEEIKEEPEEEKDEEDTKKSKKDSKKK